MSLAKKTFVLRINDETFSALAKWAEDEFRSVNGQIEMILDNALKDNGRKKNKKEDNFNLEQFRLGYEVQFGYKDVVLFGKYFPKSMFKENLGPDLRTVSVGILIGKV